MYKTLQDKRKFFAGDYITQSGEYHFMINTIPEFDQLYQTLVLEQRKSGDKILYRGMCEAKYEILTSIQRTLINSGITVSNITNKIESLITKIRENQLLSKYLAAIRLCPTDIYFLTYLQHYGAPTPMLDFTHSLDVALFFAFDSNEEPTESDHLSFEIEDYVSLYLYDKQAYYFSIVNIIDMLCSGYQNAVEMRDRVKQRYPNAVIDDSLLSSIDNFSSWCNHKNNGEGLNKICLGLVDTSEKGNIFSDDEGNVLIWENMRLIAQEGCLLMYNDPKVPLEQYLYSHKMPLLRCFNIHKGLKQYVQDKIGIIKSDIYPENSRIAKDTYKALNW